MKKKLLLGAFAALALGAGITTAVHITQTTDRASAMMLENAEALALGEMIGDKYCDTEYRGGWCATVPGGPNGPIELFHYVPSR
ncbi:hypothetical protein [uncultured Rikenella sp.]|uniref:hypothetical protein n=1 Tax=uncultured Rikenella sp. TaxID=368003 RepID=UPI002610BF03|nr:hypothetical protein [uncultured Rikenella sp.]